MVDNIIYLDHYLQPAAVETRPAASAMLSNLRSSSLRIYGCTKTRQSTCTLEAQLYSAQCSQLLFHCSLVTAALQVRLGPCVTDASAAATSCHALTYPRASCLPRPTQLTATRGQHLAALEHRVTASTSCTAARGAPVPRHKRRCSLSHSSALRQVGAGRQQPLVVRAAHAALWLHWVWLPASPALR